MSYYLLQFLVAIIYNINFEVRLIRKVYVVFKCNLMSEQNSIKLLYQI